MATDPGIPELQVTGPVRALIPGAFTLAALCFLLSFWHMNCIGIRVAGMTGADLVADRGPTPDAAGIAELQKLGKAKDLAASLLQRWLGEETVREAGELMNDLVGPNAGAEIQAMLVDEGVDPSRGARPMSSSPWAIIALAAALAGVLVPFLRLRAEQVVWTVLSLIGLVCLVFMQAELRSLTTDGAKLLGRLDPIIMNVPLGIEGSFGIGYICAIASFALAGLLAFLRPGKSPDAIVGNGEPKRV
jgi:hypothetical protein